MVSQILLQGSEDEAEREGGEEVFRIGQIEQICKLEKLWNSTLEEHEKDHVAILLSANKTTPSLRWEQSQSNCWVFTSVFQRGRSGHLNSSHAVTALFSWRGSETSRGWVIGPNKKGSRGASPSHKGAVDGTFHKIPGTSHLSYLLTQMFVSERSFPHYGLSHKKPPP